MKAFWKWLINLAIWKNYIFSSFEQHIYVYTFALWCCCASVATSRLSSAPLFGGWLTNWPPDIGDLYIGIYVHDIKKMKDFWKLLINLAIWKNYIFSSFEQHICLYFCTLVFLCKCGDKPPFAGTPLWWLISKLATWYWRLVYRNICAWH
jgi:hypothetical protein